MKHQFSLSDHYKYLLYIEAISFISTFSSLTLVVKNEGYGDQKTHS